MLRFFIVTEEKIKIGFNGARDPVRCVSSARTKNTNPRIDQGGIWLIEGILFSFFTFRSKPLLHFTSVRCSSHPITMVATESRMRTWTPLAVFSIAICATRLASASATGLGLTEEKLQLSKVGHLHYNGLSDDEKLQLFLKYETDCQRVVSFCNDVLNVKAHDNWFVTQTSDARYHVLHSDSTHPQVKRRRNTMRSRSLW